MRFVGSFSLYKKNSPDALLNTFQKDITLTNMFDKYSTIGFKLKDEIDLKTCFTN